MKPKQEILRWMDGLSARLAHVVLLCAVFLQNKTIMSEPFIGEIKTVGFNFCPRGENAMQRSESTRLGLLSSLFPKPCFLFVPKKDGLRATVRFSKSAKTLHCSLFLGLTSGETGGQPLVFQTFVVVPLSIWEMVLV